MGQLEVCAVLTQGELDIDVAVELDTVCGEACCEYRVIITLYRESIILCFNSQIFVVVLFSD